MEFELTKGFVMLACGVMGLVISVITTIIIVASQYKSAKRVRKKLNDIYAGQSHMDIR